MSTPNPGTTPWVPMWNLNGGMDLRYNGAWAAGNYYDGDVVVYQGVTYLCVRPTNKAPTPWAPGNLVVSPSVRVYRNTSFTVTTTGAVTPVPMTSARYDNGPAAHWNVNNPTRLTCQVAGTYVIWGSIQYQPAASGAQRAAYISYNGVVNNLIAAGGVRGATFNASDYPIAPAFAIMNLQVGDYVELCAFVDTANATTYASAATGTMHATEFGMALVGGMQGPQGVPGVGAVPRCKAIRTSDLALTNSAWNNLMWNGEEYDSDTIHDNATNPNRLTCRTAGQYAWILSVPVNVGGMTQGTSFFALNVNKNSDSIAGGVNDIGASYVPYIGGIGTSITASGTISLVPGDFIAGQLYQNGTGTCVVPSSSGIGHFSMWLIGSP